MKKLLSIMACVAMVLVGGLTLTACGGGKTTNATWKDYTDFVKDNAIVFEMDGYSFEEVEKTEGTLEDYEGLKGTQKVSNKMVVETETKDEVKTITKGSLTREAYVNAKSPIQSVNESGKATSYYYDGNMYSYDPRIEKNAFQKMDVQTLEYVFGSELAYLKDFKSVVEQGLQYGFELKKEVYELKEGAKFTKNVNGKDTTFKLIYENKDEKTTSTMAITFDGKKVTKLTSEIVDKSNEDYTSTITTSLISGTKVSLPKDLNKYVDMTEDGVVASFDGQYEIDEQSFENDGSIEFELQGNREYKVTGTPSTMNSQEQFAAFWGTTEDWDEDNAPKYIVIKVNHEATDEVKFGYVGETAKTLEDGDNGIVLQLDKAKKDKKYTITVKDDKNVTTTYTLDLSALYTEVA